MNISSINKPSLTLLSSIIVTSMALSACGGGGGGGKKPKPSKTNQTINFTAPSTAAVGDVSDLKATATSKLKVVYTSNSADVCSVTAAKVTAKKIGTCKITASQVGDSSFKPAVDKMVNFDVVSATIVINAEGIKANNTGKIKLSGKKVTKTITATMGDQTLTIKNKGSYQAEIDLTAEQNKIAGDVSLIIKDGNKNIYKDTIKVALPKATGNVYTVKKTGVTTCGNDTANDLACSDKATMGDYHKLNQDGDAQAGVNMAYTKVAHKTDKGDTEHCVYDNVSGLIWEQKTNDSGLRDGKWQYTWYDSNGSTNGGVAGSDAPDNNNKKDSCGGKLLKCNSEQYLAKLNAKKYCGHSDWRLPTDVELLGIRDFGKTKTPFVNDIFENIHIANIDPQSFDKGFYLTSSTIAENNPEMINAEAQQYIVLSLSSPTHISLAPYKNGVPHSVLAVRGK